MMSRPMRPVAQLTAIGFIATAVSFGPARMGFGLFAPIFREDFALTLPMLGLIASGAFIAFLAGLLAAAWLVRRYGARPPVVLGALLATAGFACAAAAPAPVMLGAGIALAGSSGGLCWVPFNEAVERMVSGEARPTVLSIISTGTAFGVMAAALLALAVIEGWLHWRGAWAGFAVSGLIMAVLAAARLPAGQRYAKAYPAFNLTVASGLPSGISWPPDAAQAARTAHPFRPGAIQLYVTAICFGVTNAIFLSYAADHVVAAGGLSGIPDEAAAVVIFLSYGLFGLLGLATGRIEARTGLGPLLGVIFGSAAASLVLVALAPASWAAVTVAAAIHGMALMMVSAVLSFWSARLFPGRSAYGFTAALLAMAAGSASGLVLAAQLVSALGPELMLLAAALAPLAMAAGCAVSSIHSAATAAARSGVRARDA